MKIFVLACLVVASASAAILHTQLERRYRDVSELAAPAYNYLPPKLKQTLPIAEESAPATGTAPTDTVLGKHGYEYRTVRRLKYRYRTSRDVSHLPSNYLPPSHEYLPPTEPANSDTEEVIAAAGHPSAKVADTYLPPAAGAAATPLIQFFSTEPPTVVETEAPLSMELQHIDVPVADDNIEFTPQDTAVLAADGYHYNQPLELPTELDSISANLYLPPADEDSEVVENPLLKASASLDDDGYRYRAIKRYRF